MDRGGFKLTLMELLLSCINFNCSFIENLCCFMCVIIFFVLFRRVDSGVLFVAFSVRNIICYISIYKFY